MINVHIQGPCTDCTSSEIHESCSPIKFILFPRFKSGSMGRSLNYLTSRIRQDVVFEQLYNAFLCSRLGIDCFA
ncbi:hypothetical protein RIR_jg16277.t1 [Rhizophagus irregularis DAOM 181602=DAOM 197198]|nr:hypothetical protein RIR_jg16277.t1 [Rhizophagus irregularis DAOM 181602=DAOM 197198]CAB5216465.1 unnamed protein product [Rhizophagus irregularis]